MLVRSSGRAVLKERSTTLSRRLASLGRLLAVASALLAVGGAVAVWSGTPRADDLAQRVTAVAAASGAPLLRPSAVPPLMAEAMVAIEDERFATHHGVDTIGLGRALAVDVTHHCACEGGSTLTQQLVNLAYYPGVNRLRRKLPSLAVAFKVETQNTKAQILADYLSIVPTGEGLTGAPAAACAYFGRPLAQLSLAQAAEIAGMPQAPSGYDPRFHPARAAARRAQVLSKMVELGYASRAAAQAADAEPVLAAGAGGC